ncbi:MAG: exopolysaccharide biosynthesis polyprenyl glycosylphosphotransferase [Pseudomonadales bacterium]|nr:exopolysaccharide biosynthesis polyprenyl glycosylphosphotransferase [Pseudomonadales bacterium]
MKTSDKTLCVYCAPKYEQLVITCLNDKKITFKINDYSFKSAKQYVFCHYRNSELTKQNRQYLVSVMARGAHVEPLVSFLDQSLGYTEIDLLHSAYFLHQKAFGILSKTKSKFEKRIIDFLFIFALALVALPIGIITAILIKLESKGPIFFKQKRVGQFNQEFEVIKFRSMGQDAEKDGAQWASKNDMRVTRIGKFIRRTRIDELPQLINVFKGEMSIIGPRPEREVFIQDLEKEIPYYRFRHAVKPGITGLAQVKYAYGASVEDAKWKHRFDLYYIKHRNLGLDLKVLLLTFKTVIFGMGR